MTTTDAVDDLLADIDQLAEVDDFPWSDAARWSPSVGSVSVDGLVYDDMHGDDGCVLMCDPERPWVVVLYDPPWWARDY